MVDSGMERYAVYFAPPPDSEHWRFGTRWLGGDPVTGQAIVPLRLPGLPPDTQHAITAHARRYGLHGTLKPPFALKQGASLAQLDEAVHALACEQVAFHFHLSVDELDGFLAWRPADGEARIAGIAAACVSELDGFRAAASADELAKRRAAGLSARQDELLLRWGYPYVMEEFRFHLTLADRMPRERLLDLRDALRRESAQCAAKPVHFDALCLFHEPAPGADFRLVARYGFDGEVTYHPGWPR